MAGRLFATREEADRAAGRKTAYASGDVCDVVMRKGAAWMDKVDPGTYPLPPHLAALMLVAAVAAGRLGRPVHVVDLGGGVPMAAALMARRGLSWVAAWKIVELPAFVERVPEAWRRVASFHASLDSAGQCDLAVACGVLAYLPRSAVGGWLQWVEEARPAFVYLGRTSYLREEGPFEERYAVQVARLADHGPPAPGVEVPEGEVAHVWRHFRRSEVAAVLEGAGYRPVLRHQDDSGLGAGGGDLGVHACNELWERKEGGGA